MEHVIEKSVSGHKPQASGKAATGRRKWWRFGSRKADKGSREPFPEQLPSKRWYFSSQGCDGSDGSASAEEV